MRFVRTVLALLVLAPTCTAEPTATDAFHLFEAARAAGSPEEAVPLLERAAGLGLAAAQAMIGLAYAQGHGGLAVDATEAVRWFRKAAEQENNADSAYNLVAICEARPQCVGGTAEQLRVWLADAAAQNLTSACFELGNLVLGEDAARALALFLRASRAGHAGASYNAGHVLALGRDGVDIDLTRAMVPFRGGHGANSPPLHARGLSFRQRLSPRVTAARVPPGPCALRAALQASCSGPRRSACDARSQTACCDRRCSSATLKQVRVRTAGRASTQALRSRSCGRGESGGDL